MADDTTSTDERLAQDYAREAVAHPPTEAWQRLIDGARSINVDAHRLREIFAQAYATHFAHETFWLFTDDALACVPSGGDRTMVEGLESRWQAFDGDVRSQSLDDGTESARRAALLAEARMAALFDETLFDARLACLDEWGLPTLTSIAKAGRTLAAYLASPERQRYVRDAKPSTIREAPLSLDLIRWTEPPSGVPLFAWLSLCEEALTNMPLKGMRGTVYVGQGGAAVTVKWRCEDGARNVVYEASLRK